MFDRKRLEAVSYIQKIDEYGKWNKEIPFIELKDGYQCKPGPNSVGSVVRFLAKKKGSEKAVSIYLDCYSRLGSCGDKPYWEMYPSQDGDNLRFFMDDVEGLSKAIVEALEDSNER